MPRGEGGRPGAGYRQQQALFGMLAAYLAVLALGGGTARFDAQSLLFVRPAAILFLGALLLLAWPLRFDGRRRTLAFAAACIGSVAFQLVPLPPAFWSALPGRAPFAEGLGLAGAEAAWRPLTLAPAATRNTLASLFVPLAALLGAAVLKREWHAYLLTLCLVVIGASALLSMLQIAAGPGGTLRLYNVTNQVAGVGLFANRNHNALLLCLGFPILAWKARRMGPAGSRLPFVRWSWWAAGLFLLVSIATTGSRFGFLLAFLSIAASLALFASPDWRRNRRRLLAGAAGAVLVAGATAVLLAGTRTVTRFKEASVADDPRFQIAAEVDAMLGDFFPYGSGFGSFRFVFPAYEQVDEMGLTYTNHAHNDLLQLTIEGGAPALLLLLLFLYWWVPAAWAGLRSREEGGLARVASLCTGFILLASLVEFPLRAPLISALFVLLCVPLFRSSEAPPGGDLGLDRSRRRV